MNGSLQNLHGRPLYLKQLISFQDKDVIKVITGIRRCGKSSILKLMAHHLLDSGIRPEQILEINFESLKYGKLSHDEFYQYVADKVVPGQKIYLFLDEIQQLPGWELAVNSFRVDFACDIYLTGSNAFLLSSKLATYLSGRYVEIKMLPLSFREFVEFQGYRIETLPNFEGEPEPHVLSPAGQVAEKRQLFSLYLKYGGMPGLIDIGFNHDKVMTVLDGIYSAVVVRDILERERRPGERAVTDAHLLRKLALFLADNIGNMTSATSIGNVLAHEGLAGGPERGTKPATHTIQSYVGALVDAYVFYEVRRFDIKGKECLRTLGKYYLADLGFRNYLLGFRDGDRGHVIENIVYLELLRRRFEVSIGKVGRQEIDFIASTANDKKYIQVTESMHSPQTRERELAPLRQIRDNYEKTVITLESDYLQTQDGIKIVNLLDFLLAEY